MRLVQRRFSPGVAAQPDSAFAEIDVDATQQVATLRRELIATVIAEKDQIPVPNVHTCDGQQLDPRDTISGAECVTLTGTGYRCSACGAELSPLAEALNPDQSGYSPWLADGAVRLGADRAFAPAADLLTHFTGVTTSPVTPRRLTVSAGSRLR